MILNNHSVNVGSNILAVYYIVGINATTYLISIYSSIGGGGSS